MGVLPTKELVTIGLLFIVLFLLAGMLQRWRIPALLGFMLAGFLLQSYEVRSLAPILPMIGDLAVWLLFFFVGLEYSPEHLLHMSRNIARPGLIDFTLNFGGATGIALFFSSPLQAVLFGSAMYPSSTAIVVRLLLDYRRLVHPEAELLLGLLIFEDLVGVVLLGVLTPISNGNELNLWLLFRILSALGGTLLLFWAIYRWILPRLKHIQLGWEEEPLVIFLTLGLILLVGAGGHAIGLSGALTAFLLGVLLPEGSSLYRAAEKSLLPIRELSVGLFFFALSYSVELDKLPLAVGTGWIAVGLLLKLISTYWAARLWGLKPRTAWRAALSFLPKGEFSLLFGMLTAFWRSAILLVVLGSTILGTVAFATADLLLSRTSIRSREKSSPLPP